MTVEEATKLIFAALAEVAPEVDATSIDTGNDLTEQIDLDSMDYLAWMLAIGKSVGSDIPHRDMSQFLTIDGAASYLASSF